MENLWRVGSIVLSYETDAHQSYNLGLLLMRPPKHAFIVNDLVTNKGIIRASITSGRTVFKYPDNSYRHIAHCFMRIHEPWMVWLW